ncbi:SIR2 family protein [Rhizobium johnstonii]|uniref:SIR2 family protein n=1 Tax=Rhizobium johnstonii TaxID=3019933 RepID=UPI003F961CAD
MKNEDRAFLRGYARAVVHMRERHASKGLGLILGAGVSQPLGFPAWGELVERIASSPDVQGDHLLAAANGLSDTAKTQMLLQHFRTKRLDQLGFQLSARSLRKIHGEWRRIVQTALYRDTPKEAKELNSTHPYLSSLIGVIAESPMTVTYNFDDTIEKLLQFAKNPNDNAYGRGFETIWDAALQPKRDVAVIYHPNGYLPSNLLEYPSENLVFSEDSFADQLIESMAGHHASLLHHLARTTCVFVGLSLQDETLRHLLRQNARINPGQFHYYIFWRRAGEPRNLEAEKLMQEANFDVYNLITLFLDDDEIGSLGRLITTDDADIRRAAEEEGVELRYVYYLTGAIGAGKTTTLSYLGSLITFEEWTEARNEFLGKSWVELTEPQREEVDEWIQRQFVNKNIALIEKSAGVIVVDRPPLDPLSFSKSAEVAAKAEKMMGAFSPGKSNRRVVQGQIIMLDGTASEFEARVIGRHKESTAVIIEDLQINLRRIYQQTHDIDTSGSSIHYVVKSVAKIIHLGAYQPVDLHVRLTEIATEGLKA